MRYGQAIVLEGLAALPFRRTSQPVYDRPFEIHDLYVDPRTGAEHYVVRYPAGLRSKPHRHTAAHTIVVLAGRMTVNGREVGPGSYVHVPGGETMLHEPAGGGCCLFVLLFDGPFDVEAVEG